MDKKILEINFGNLIEDLRKNDLKLILLKDKVGMFIQDINNNIYEIETYWLGSYLDKLIKNKATVVFNLIDRNMISNFDKEIFTWKNIQDFIEKNSGIQLEKEASNMNKDNVKLKYTDITKKPPINERNPNLFYYDLRDADEGLGYDIERNVIINNIGSIVTNKDILGDREFITDEEFEMLEAEYVEKIEELLEQKADKNNELNEEFYKNICNKYINTMSKEMLLEIDNRIVHIFIEDEYINLKDNDVINTHNFRNYLDGNFEIYAYNSYQELCERLIKDEIFYDIKDLGLFDENNKWNFYITQEELEKLRYEMNEKDQNVEDDFEDFEL